MRVTQDAGLWSIASTHALKKGRQTVAIPVLLVAHVLVLVHDPSSNRSWFLLSRRAVGANEVEWAPGAWSVSLEEQFRPVAGIVRKDRRDHVEQADASLAECAARGVKEELGVIDKLSLELQGLVVEADNFNIGCLAVARIRRTMADLREACIGADDRAESDAIVAIPLEPRLLKTLLEDNTGPTRDILHGEGKYLRGEFEEGPWHGTSRIRIALALWLAEREALRPRQGEFA
jgi:hypothetical protein